MKKFVFIALLAVLFLVACNSQKKKEVTKTPEPAVMEEADSVSAMSDTVAMEGDSVSMEEATDTVSME